MHNERETKIIATLGPSCQEKNFLTKIIKTGVDLVRLNFSHNTHEWHGNMIELIKKISKETNKKVAIIADIQGPKIRLGNLPKDGIQIKSGQEIIIDTSSDKFDKNRIPLPSSIFKNGTKAGHLVFIDDGNLQVKIISKQNNLLRAVVLKSGTLFSKKGINAPSLEINSSILSSKDKADIKFAVYNNVDYLALSFVRNAKDIKEARKFIGKTNTKIIAKIERHEALLKIEEITEEADAVMIARGDLGIETPLWELPIRQKEIISMVRKKRKPVIVATQMLDSMIRNPIPTRAEVSDVANAVFDHADAVMLSGETASGNYPLEAVSMMVKILEATDSHRRNNLKI
jgi:pyruvate kinase